MPDPTIRPVVKTQNELMRALDNIANGFPYHVMHDDEANTYVIGVDTNESLRTKDATRRHWFIADAS